MLPTMTRASEEILRTVPDSLPRRLARAGRAAVAARAAGRVADRARGPRDRDAARDRPRDRRDRTDAAHRVRRPTTTNTNPLQGPQSDLPLFVWKLIRLPNKTQIDRAWTGALILVMLVFVLFVGRPSRRAPRAEKAREGPMTTRVRNATPQPHVSAPSGALRRRRSSRRT